MSHSFRPSSELQERSSCPGWGQAAHCAGDDNCLILKGGGKAKAVPIATRAKVPRTPDAQMYVNTADDQLKCLQYLFNPRRSARPVLDDAWLEPLSFETRTHHMTMTSLSFQTRAAIETTSLPHQARVGHQGRYRSTRGHDRCVQTKFTYRSDHGPW